MGAKSKGALRHPSGLDDMVISEYIHVGIICLSLSLYIYTHIYIACHILAYWFLVECPFGGLEALAKHSRRDFILPCLTNQDRLTPKQCLPCLAAKKSTPRDLADLIALPPSHLNPLRNRLHIYIYIYISSACMQTTDPLNRVLSLDRIKTDSREKNDTMEEETRSNIAEERVEANKDKTYTLPDIKIKR